MNLNASCITIFVLLLDRLNFVFKAPLLPALVIVDHRDVTTITCPSGRKIHQVNTLLTEGDCHLQDIMMHACSQSD